jgi:hypothetical protein
MSDDLTKTLLDIARAGMATPKVSGFLPEGECKTCDAYRHETMAPRHTASPNCQSGKHPHCTCDTCF